MTPAWARPSYTGALAAWGMVDTGVRPRRCNVTGCLNPRRGSGHYQCSEHLAAQQATRVRKSSGSAATHGR